MVLLMVVGSLSNGSRFGEIPWEPTLDTIGIGSATQVLALPNSVLPLSSSALAAIFVANRVSLPFFDANLATRRPEQQWLCAVDFHFCI